jgi:hypothetical protein
MIQFSQTSIKKWLVEQALEETEVVELVIQQLNINGKIFSVFWRL